MLVFYNHADDSEEVQQNWLRELKLMAEVGREHCNVLFLLGVVINQEAKLAAVFEFCEFGSLKSYIIKKKSQFRLFSNRDTETISEVSN